MLEGRLPGMFTEAGWLAVGGGGPPKRTKQNKAENSMFLEGCWALQLWPNDAENKSDEQGSVSTAGQDQSSSQALCAEGGHSMM